MNPLFAAAVEIQNFCGTRGWRSSVIGGLAVQRWGDPRQTRDVDLTVLAGLGGEEAFVDPVLEHYRARIPGARLFALERRVLLVETRDGVPLDISLGGLPYETAVVDRSTVFEIEPGVGVTTCSAEDLVILKTFAGRPQDWIDVEGIIVRQRAALDRRLVLADLRPLLELKDDTTAEPRLLGLFEKHRA